MPSDEVKHFVEGDPGHLRGAAERDFPLAQEVEGFVDPGLSQPSLNETSEGFRTIRLEPLGESIDFSEALLREADRDRLGHVYDIIYRIQRPFERDPGFKATSHWREANTGLYCIFRRSYDPDAGRFPSQDRILGHLTVPQSLNRYAYAVNNLLRYVDPTREDWWSPLIQAGASSPP